MFSSMKIAPKLFLLVAFMSFMMFAVCFISIYTLKNLHKETDDVFNTILPLPFLEKLSDIYSIEVPDTMRLLNQGKITWEEAENKVTKASKEITVSLKSYLGSNLTVEQRLEADKIISLVNNAKTSLEILIPLIKRKDEEALKRYVDIDIFLHPISTAIGVQIDEHLQNFENEFKDLEYAYSSALWEITVAFIIAFLTSILLAYIIVRGIQLAFEKVLKTIQGFAVGNLSADFEHVENVQNEFDVLMHALEQTIASQKNMIGALNRISEGNLTAKVPLRSKEDILAITMNRMIAKLREMIVNIQNESVQLASAAGEITNSVSEVSASTAETASAVTETTTTVEELKQTVHVSADKTRDVLKNYEETLQVVKETEKSLDTTIEEMHQIEEKMRTISDSIVKLSEHSLAIGEIIDTVNDLSEQSNLLAVNAAIEASKAGEQGKSFGIVAQEIRILAEQSKGATVQIRSILNDIQNATSSAVMATEQGARAVAKGVSQSTEMNASIHSLSSSVSNANESAQQIAFSSQQQLQGVGQVTVAMSNIDEASSQNAIHMREIETSVRGLQQISEKLKELVKDYKI